jgi:hypothetical protein
VRYVFVDFENVQPPSLGALAGEDAKVLVFVGASQTKVTIELAAALQPLGSQVEYIRAARTGRNALDFHIAYYLGKLAQSDPSASFHIVSADKGFDPLLDHLLSLGVSVSRVTSAVPRPVSANPRVLAGHLATTLAWLKATKASRPRTVKTLRSSVAALFKKKLSKDEVSAVLASLTERGHISITGAKVGYGDSDA